MDFAPRQSYSSNQILAQFDLGAREIEPASIVISSKAVLVFFSPDSVREPDYLFETIQHNHKVRKKWPKKDFYCFLQLDSESWFYLRHLDQLRCSSKEVNLSVHLDEKLPKEVFNRGNGGQDWFSKGGGFELSAPPGERVHDRILEGNSSDSGAYFLSRWEGDDLTFEYDRNRAVLRYGFYHEDAYRTYYAFAPESHDPPANEDDILWEG